MSARDARTGAIRALASRRHEVLALLAEGRSDASISGTLFLSHKRQF